MSDQDLPLTPMERRLLEALERMEADWQAREERLSEQIAGLQTQIASQAELIERQNEAIANLQMFFARLTSPPGSPPSPKP